MEKQYEVPELTLVGQAEDVVLGLSGCGSDNNGYAADDFEFEPD
jgi:hypothetical protein